jgi:hemerythrin-like domain-containing protein
MPRAIEMMNERQRAMSSVLLAVRTLARAAVRAQSRPDFAQLRRLVGYVERYPQKIHQAAEEQHLFRAILAREPNADEYVRFCRLHARVEARDLLSVALKVLSDSEWQAIERAYAAANDPLAASKSRQECAQALSALL